MNNNINEAEFNILSLLLLYPDLQTYIFEHCDTDFFTNPLYRQIFEVAKEIYNNRQPVDNVAIYTELQDKDIGEILVELIEHSLANKALVKKYCNILYKTHLKHLIENAKTNKDFDYIQEIKRKYETSEIQIKHISDGAESFQDEYYKRIDSMLLTGYKSLDKEIGAFSGGDYIALGGSTGIGKTSIALNLAKKMCEQGKTVLYCSLEMPLNQLRNRFTCMISGLNAMKYRSCGFSREEFDNYEKSLKLLDNWNLYILCDYNLTVDKLKAYIEKQKRIGLDFVIIDYLGLMSGYTNKSLYERTTSISREIKVLATEMNLPILVLVQLNRDLKNRQDKRPMLSDIRESGAIEQDADYVLFAHREGLYDEHIKPNELTIIIAKNRHGSSRGECRLRFDLETQLISDYPEWYHTPKR